ncbi:MAG: purine-nucleoside phosphorylase [Pseudomonadota bacterium]
MSLHIGAAPEDIAPTVLMPGDPMRAKWAAETFLTDPRQVNAVRGMLGYTGTWQGHPVTIHGSGMGMPTLAVYATELLRDYGVKTLMRIGSTGAMQPDIKLRDIILPMTASSISTPSAALFREVRFAPCADWTLLRAAAANAEARGIAPHIGGIYSSDTFYDERPDLNALMTRHGTLCVEMETAELYIQAARYSARALSVLTVSDHLITGEELPQADRESSFTDMVEIALDAAFAHGS